MTRNLGNGDELTAVTGVAERIEPDLIITSPTGVAGHNPIDLRQ